MALKAWLEATRPRTLPVSMAGVVAGWACGVHCGGTHWLQGLLCLLFAALAQIASNFGNEYFDFRNGMDRRGREGFRRGVTEGDLGAGAMLAATLGTLAAAGVVGLLMMWLSGEWWLLLPGAAVAVFALAYSAGPWPLSHHGLGDIAVVVFFGLVPVCLTSYLVCGAGWEALPLSLPLSVSVGLLGANVLIVNNYRDADDDRTVGKHTTVVLFGRPAMANAYLLSGLTAMLCAVPVWWTCGWLAWGVPLLCGFLHIKLWRLLRHLKGAALNPLLGMTAMLLLLFSLLTATALLLTA